PGCSRSARGPRRAPARFSTSARGSAICDCAVILMDDRPRCCDTGSRPTYGDVLLRKFLIILDDTPEMLNAMRYAAIRASKTGGGVEMLAVISPEEFQHFMGVADVMRAEAHEKVEAHFQIFKDRMEKREGLTPTL